MYSSHLINVLSLNSETLKLMWDFFLAPTRKVCAKCDDFEDLDDGYGCKADDVSNTR